MEIAKPISCALQVVARLQEDGTLKAEVVGSVEYAKGRSVTKSLPVSDAAAKGIGLALSTALQESGKAVAIMTDRAADEALTVATRMGEI